MDWKHLLHRLQRRGGTRRAGGRGVFAGMARKTLDGQARAPCWCGVRWAALRCTPLCFACDVGRAGKCSRGLPQENSISGHLLAQRQPRVSGRGGITFWTSMGVPGATLWQNASSAPNYPLYLCRRRYFRFAHLSLPATSCRRRIAQRNDMAMQCAGACGCVLLKPSLNAH